MNPIVVDFRSRGIVRLASDIVGIADFLRDANKDARDFRKSLDSIGGAAPAIRTVSTSLRSIASPKIAAGATAVKTAIASTIKPIEKFASVAESGSDAAQALEASLAGAATQAKALARAQTSANSSLSARPGHGATALAKGSTKAIQPVTSLTTKVQTLASSVYQLNLQLAQTKSHLSALNGNVNVKVGGTGGAARSASSGSASNGASRGARKPPIVPGFNGPFTKLIKLQQAMGLPQSFSPQQAFALNQAHALKGAQAHVNKLLGIQPQRSFGSRLASFIASSRFGAGGGMMPLVGQAMQLVGLSTKLAGPVGVAVAVVKGFVDAAAAARDRLNQIAAAGAISGGNGGQSTVAGRLGIAVGGSGTDVASDARRLYGDVSGGGMAASIAAQYGYRAVQGFGQKVNKLGVGLDLIRKVIEDPNERRANLAAQELGLEKYLPLRNADPEYRDRLFSGEAGPTREQARNAANYNAALAGASTVFGKIVTALGSPLLATGAKWLKNIADYGANMAPRMELLGRAISFVAENSAIGYLISALPYVGKALDFVWSKIEWMVDEALGLGASLAPGLFGPIKASWEKLKDDEAKKKAAQANSIDANTDAVNANTKELRAAREYFGGGERTRHAVPAGWQKNNFDRYMRSQAAALGAFAL